MHCKSRTPKESKTLPVLRRSTLVNARPDGADAPRCGTLLPGGAGPDWR
jgi:hypothetical protein